MEQQKIYPTSAAVDELAQFDMPFGHSGIPGTIRAMDPTGPCSPIITPQMCNITCGQALLTDSDQSFHIPGPSHQWSSCNPPALASNHYPFGYQAPVTLAAPAQFDESTCFISNPIPENVPRCIASASGATSWDYGGQNVYRDVTHGRPNLTTMVNLRSTAEDEYGNRKLHYANPTSNSVPRAPLSGTMNSHSQFAMNKNNWMTNSVHLNHENLSSKVITGILLTSVHCRLIDLTVKP